MVGAVFSLFPGEVRLETLDSRVPECNAVITISERMSVMTLTVGSA